MNALQWDPGKLIQLSGNYLMSCGLHTAIKLDVFTRIGSEELTNEDIARRLDGDTRGVTMLLNALTAMNLLEKREGQYSNTSESSRFLSRGSPQYVGYSILLFHHMMSSWVRLDEAVLTGKPVRVKPSYTDEEYRVSFQKSMHTMAMSLAPQVAKAIDLSNRQHLLDLGGGPGTYAVHFCLHNPRLRATVYDLPTTRPFAEEIIRQFGMTDRIDFKEVDYLREDIEGVYDVAWLSQVLHSEGPGDCEMIIRKAVTALKPGGIILVHDLILNNAMDGPLFPALFSLNMLLLTPEGQTYPEERIMDLLAETGVREIRRIPFQGPHDSGIIAGVVE
jgi:SAM-dependent methyltransferase